jgi:hypothetical protein
MMNCQSKLHAYTLYNNPPVLVEVIISTSHPVPRADKMGLLNISNRFASPPTLLTVKPSFITKFPDIQLALPTLEEVTLLPINSLLIR